MSSIYSWAPYLNTASYSKHAHISFPYHKDNDMSWHKGKEHTLIQVLNMHLIIHTSLVDFEFSYYTVKYLYHTVATDQRILPNHIHRRGSFLKNLVKKWSFITVFTRACHLAMSWAWSVHTPHTDLSKIYIKILNYI